MSEPGLDKEKKICPVCDEMVPADANSCPSCSTDLSLFQVDGQRVEVEEDLEIVGQTNGHVGDLLKAAEEDPLESLGTTPQAQPDGVEMFECPECNAMIPDDANSCPNCGVEFSDEAVFECPLCKTLIDVEVDKCPNCGAEFAEEEEEAEDVVETSPPVEAKPAAPEPEPEKEMSFAERMKAVKEAKPDEKKEEAPAQPKELSFAERMKAMKEGKTVDSAPAEGAPKPGTTTPEPAPEPAGAKPATPKVETPIPKAQTGPEPSVKPAETAPAQKPQDLASLKEKYKELPRLIGEVKKSLAIAKKCKIKDLESAVRLVEEGKAGIEKTILAYMDERVKALTLKINEANSSGHTLPEATASIVKIKGCLEACDYDSALIEIETTDSMLKETVGEELLDAKTELKLIDVTIGDAKVLSIELGSALALYEEARKAADKGDWSSAALYSKQAMDSLNEILPSHISSQMKKAKTSLLEIKMMNIDISQPVEFLKSANIAVKEGKYLDALHCVRQFKDHLDKEDFEM